MEAKYNIVIGHLIRLFMGVGLGCVLISNYVITVGSSFHFSTQLYSFTLMTSAFGILVEVFLEVSSGYRADKFGEKTSLSAAMFVRSLSFAGLLIALSMTSPSPLFYTLLILILSAGFGLSRSLIGGNFEEWLQKQCDEKNSMKVFAFNYVMYGVGLVLGASFAFITPPSHLYSQLLDSVMLTYGFSFVCSFLVIILILMAKTNKAFSLKDMGVFIGSYFVISKSKIQNTRKEVQKAREELKGKPHLEKVFWVNSGVYAMDLTLETLVVIHLFAAGHFDLKQKFILFVCCCYMPNIIGGFLKMISKTKNQKQSLQNLARETMFLFLVTILVSFTLFIPIQENVAWFLDPVFLSFALMIMVFKMLVGQLFPHYYNLTSKWAQENSELPKTVLSIGEKRKKAAVFISMFLSALGGFFGLEEAHFIVLSVIAFGFMVYSYFVFKDLTEREEDKALSQQG